MEDASKAIELAVGVIIFIIALTIAVLLYNKLADTANNALSINDTQNSVTYNKNNISKDFGYVYTYAEVCGLINDIRENADSDMYSELNNYNSIAIYKGYMDPTTMEDTQKAGTSRISASSSGINAVDTSDLNAYGANNTDSRYKIKCTYENYEESTQEQLNGHKPTKIEIILYEE